jgi:hypothetical protein
MEVRRRFSKVCQEIMDVVGKQKKQVLSLGRRRQLQKSIKVIKNINFYDDVEIERHSKEIHAMLCKDEKDLNIKEFKTVFKNAISDMDKQFFPKSF